MELKGKIELGNKRSLTCCDSIHDILINGESLYDALNDLFNLDAQRFWNHRETRSPYYYVKYVILDEEPEEDKTFNEQSAEVVMDMLYGEHKTGCYSEWTCGIGNFDYVHQNGGHSIFKELEDKEGKYIHFEI